MSTSTSNPTLTTLPPELLLTIITHLPTSSHFLSLSQTSHYLRSFLSTYAKTICNTHIKTYYPIESKILHSKHNIDGWLLPTHRCVLDEENDQRDQEKIRGQRYTNIIREQRNTERRRGQRRNRRWVDSRKLNKDFNCLSFPLFRLFHRAPPSLPPPSPALLATNLSLTTPGPHYLLFLERYASEIIIENFLRVASENGLRVNGPQRARETRGASSARIASWDVAFDYWVRVHCMRRFIQDVKRELGALDTKLAAQTRPDLGVGDGRGDENAVRGKGYRGWSKMKERLTSIASIRIRVERVSSIQIRVERDGKVVRRGVRHGHEGIDHQPLPVKPKVRRPLLFGEIAKSDKEPRMESWKKGLIWYHPMSFSSSTFNTAQDIPPARPKISTDSSNGFCPKTEMIPAAGREISASSSINSCPKDEMNVSEREMESGEGGKKERRREISSVKRKIGGLMRKMRGFWR